MAGNACLLGLDVGSSSVKACLLDAQTGVALASAASPETELDIDAPEAGWAQQDPEVWWDHVVRAVGKLDATLRRSVVAIGISYQMHGLVALNEAGEVVRPSIIWCDSRAVPYGESAFSALGEELCLSRLLNSPGNFTLSKLAWVKDKEPENFARIARIMLPGDYIGYRMTGEMMTTYSGLSEAVAYDVKTGGPAGFLLEYFGFPESLIPPVTENFGDHGSLTSTAAERLGVPSGTPLTYRAGDQPNNALSLNVLRSGELAATAGTSGVVYGVVDRPAYDPASRVNTFVHVNHRPGDERYGVLLCLNGTGILNRWMREQVVEAEAAPGSVGYAAMNSIAAGVPIGSEGVVVLPFGNGAERMLENRNPGASVHGLDFNRHRRAHMVRAAQEGIVFGLIEGLSIMKEMGLPLERVKAGYANMFLSPVFAEAFSTVGDLAVELYSTDGAEGAARGAGIGGGFYGGVDEAFVGLRLRETIEPRKDLAGAYQDAYGRWREVFRRSVLTASTE